MQDTPSAGAQALGYSAAIVSLLGTIHWGLTMRGANGQSTSMMGVAF